MTPRELAQEILRTVEAIKYLEELPNTQTAIGHLNEYIRQISNPTVRPVFTQTGSISLTRELERMGPGELKAVDQDELNKYKQAAIDREALENAKKNRPMFQSQAELAKENERLAKLKKEEITNRGLHQ
jgi:hypothetical protein